MIDPQQPLRTYQAIDLSFFTEQPRSMILYEPRMGKTVVAVNACFDGNSHNILIICPLNAFYVWVDHFTEWAKFVHPNKTIQVIMVRGTAQQRDTLFQKPRTCDYNVFVMVQATFIRDVNDMLNPTKKGFWFSFDTIIVDEFHKWLNSRKSKTFTYLAPLAKTVKRIHLLSGTPIDKGPHQFWPALHLLNPVYFSSYWKFADTYCVFNETGFSREYVGPQNLDELHRVLNRYARIRDRSETSMPKLTRSLIHVEMTKKQKQLHDQIDTEDFAVMPDASILVTPNVMEKWIRLRQILTCPAIFDTSAGPGAALENLADQLSDLPRESQHVVVFTSFRAALPLFAEFLSIRLDIPVQILHGGLEPDVLRLRIQAFRQSKGIMLCSSQYAQAFSLEPAQACYHIGWDWSPNINKQAEDRLISQSGPPINSFYYSHIDSYVEQRVAEVVVTKHAIVSAILNRDP